MKFIYAISKLNMNELMACQKKITSLVGYREGPQLNRAICNLPITNKQVY